RGRSGGATLVAWIKEQRTIRGILLPGALRNAPVAVLYTVVEITVRHSAERFVVQARHAPWFPQILLKGGHGLEVRGQRWPPLPRGGLKELLVAAIDQGRDLRADQDAGPFRDARRAVRAALQYGRHVAPAHTDAAPRKRIDRESGAAQILQPLLKCVLFGLF